MISSLSPAKKLAIVRFVFFITILWLTWDRQYFRIWAFFPQEFWLSNGLMSILDLRPITGHSVDTWISVWNISTLFAALGFFYRITAPLSLACGAVIVGMSHSFGMHSHVYLPWITAGIPLAFSRAADAFSIDAYLRIRLGRARTELGSDQYFLPIMVMRLAFVLVFFAAGIAKVVNGGWEWVSSDTLRNFIFRSSRVYADVNPLAHAAKLNDFLYQFPLLCKFLAFTTVAVELCAPVALFSRRTAYVLIPVLIAMQIGIFFMIFVNFMPYLAIYACWLVPISERNFGRIVFKFDRDSLKTNTS